MGIGPGVLEGVSSEPHAKRVPHGVGVWVNRLRLKETIWQDEEARKEKDTETQAGQTGLAEEEIKIQKSIQYFAATGYSPGIIPTTRQGQIGKTLGEGIIPSS